MKNKIKVFTFLGILVSVCTAAAFSFSATITGMDGTVNYVKSGTSQWLLASVGTVLYNGDKIGSKEDSWAEISFSAGHKAKLGPNSFMVINQMSETTSLELFKGNLLSKVRKLSKAETYEIKTPQSVASVKGTEFNVTVDEESRQTQVAVYEGKVMAREIITGIEVEVIEGKYTQINENTAPSEPEDITNLETENIIPAEDEIAAEEPKDEEEPEEEAQEEEIVKAKVVNIREEIRQEIREAIVDIKFDVEIAQDIVETTKENDSSTGRTLKDVHGNLVRVEQYINRPDPGTIQFINITKRSDYKYGGRMNVSPTGARLDSLEAKVSFNRELPDKISDWGNFFADVMDSEDDYYFHPTSFEVKTSNQQDSIVVSSTWDDAEKDMKEPVVKLNSATMGEWLLDTAEYDSGSLLALTEEEAGSGVFWSSEDKLESWMVSPQMRIYRDTLGGGTLNAYDDGDESKLVRFGQELWLINNDGAILDAGTFSQDFSGNPFDLIKNMAFENSGVCRYNVPVGSKLDIVELDEKSLTDADYQNILATYNSGTDLFSRNIDLVVTPDLMLNMAETIAKNMDLSKIDFDSEDTSDNY